MKKFTVIIILLLSAIMLYGKGLRYSVCQVLPEYNTQEKTILSDMSLFLSRQDRSEEARYLQTLPLPIYYGSGVVVEMDGPKLLTTRQVVGYASHVTVMAYLHDKTLRYRGCRVLGCNPSSDLVLVQLPEGNDLEAIAVAEEGVDEGDEIRSAGFALLNNQPTWQLVSGWVSNASLRLDGHVYIQHGAPFNPGVAGGPILVKKDSAYQIVGLNMGRIGHRDEVALAIPVSDIRHFLHADSLHNDNADLNKLQDFQFKEWAELMKKLTEEERTALAKEHPTMPLDWIISTLDNKDFYEQRAEEREAERLSKRGLTTDVCRFKQNLFYHNYLSAHNQETGISMEFALGKRKISFIGLQFACAFTEARPMSYWFTGFYQRELYDPEPIFSPLFGAYTGVQIPLRVGNKHLLVPRLSLGGNIGPGLNTYDNIDDKYSVESLMITSDARVGLEYHYQLKRMALIVALEYTAHVFATDAEAVWRYTNGNVTAIDAHTQLLKYNKEAKLDYTCFNHGLGLRFAIGF